MTPRKTLPLALAACGSAGPEPDPAGAATRAAA